MEMKLRSHRKLQCQLTKAWQPPPPQRKNPKKSCSNNETNFTSQLHLHKTLKLTIILIIVAESLLFTVKCESVTRWILGASGMNGFGSKVSYHLRANSSNKFDYRSSHWSLHTTYECSNYSNCTFRLTK